MQCPCRGCDLREIDCHAKCEKYNSWNKDRLDKKHNFFKQHEAQVYAIESCIRVVKKTKRQLT